MGFKAVRLKVTKAKKKIIVKSPLSSNQFFRIRKITPWQFSLNPKP